MTRTSKIVAGGFLVRAFLGQALFWISYLRLPIARSLQLGDGFWFFAPDAPYYLFVANAAAKQGFAGIFLQSGPVPCHLFIKLLAILVAVLGPVASLAILINCAAYALTCALLVRMRQSDLLLAAIAFSPAAMLFSLQLLKDTLFYCLIVLMAAAFLRWQELWRRGARPGSFVACAAAMLASVYALSGIRWYFAAIVWTSSAIFFVLVSWSVRRKGLALAVGAVLFVLLAQCVHLGSMDMPPSIRRLLNPLTVFQSSPGAVPKFVRRARSAFDITPASTTIAPGRSVAPDASPPKSFTARVITGFSGTFLPRFVAQAAGLVHIGGGRSFWIFAEVDTILFDLVLVYVGIFCVRALRRGDARATPLFAMLILVFVITAGLMTYTVNNFGTIFRLRQILYVIATVIPITLLTSRHEENGKFDRR